MPNQRGHAVRAQSEDRDRHEGGNPAYAKLLHPEVEDAAKSAKNQRLDEEEPSAPVAEHSMENLVEQNLNGAIREAPGLRLAGERQDQASQQLKESLIRLSNPLAVIVIPQRKTVSEEERHRCGYQTDADLIRVILRPTNDSMLCRPGHNRGASKKN